MKDREFIALCMMNLLVMLVIAGAYASLAYKIEHIKPVVVTEYITATPAEPEEATETEAEVSIEVREVELHKDIKPYLPTEVEETQRRIHSYTTQICSRINSNDSVEEIISQEKIGAYFGNMELTAYIATGNPCADGVYPKTNHTAACNNPALWHKWVYIEGIGNYYIHDTGGMASNVIDIYMGSYGEAIQFGRRKGEVYIIERND